MLGIDIVDLADPLIRTRRSALRFISNKGDEYPETENIFWILWAAKEAVFKVDRIVTSFQPKQIAVKLQYSKGGFCFSSEDISGYILVDSSKIIAVAYQNNLEVAIQIFQKDVNDWSRAIRNELHQFFARKNLDVRLSKCPQGLPILNDQPLSFSHHGKFGAFAYIR